MEFSFRGTIPCHPWIFNQARELNPLQRYISCHDMASRIFHIMRMNELLQMSISRKCLVQLVEYSPLHAADQSPRLRYLFRLIPKGERTLTLHNYAVGKETIQLVEKVCHMLSEHYRLQPGEPLPHVPFAPGDGRSHRFEPAPYLFQYSSQHLNGITITACLRFLLHGMILTGSDGKPVTIKAHLLRHAFATYAVQIEGVPLDLVAEWLKQKNLEVTDYDSKKTPGMVAEEHASFVSRLAARIQAREAILRSPQEIQKQAESALKRVEVTLRYLAKIGNKVVNKLSTNSVGRVKSKDEWRYWHKILFLPLLLILKHLLWSDL